MRIIKMSDIAGKKLTQHGSDMVLRKVLMTHQPSHVCILELGDNGIVGYHEATVPQVLVVIEGEGWVRTGEEKVRIFSGDVVIWDKGEGHETTSDFGLKAIMIESEGLDLHSFFEH